MDTIYYSDPPPPTHPSFVNPITHSRLSLLDEGKRKNKRLKERGGKIAPFLSDGGNSSTDLRFLDRLYFPASLLTNTIEICAAFRQEFRQIILGFYLARTSPMSFFFFFCYMHEEYVDRGNNIIIFWGYAKEETGIKEGQEGL